MKLVFLISEDGSEIELFIFSLALMYSRTTLFDSSCKQTFLVEFRFLPEDLYIVAFFATGCSSMVRSEDYI
jgi:hypothetical protein